MGSSAPTLTPTMEPTGLPCPTSTIQSTHELDTSTCRPKGMICTFELEECETADYKCLTVCTGLCSNSNLVQQEAPYKQLTCPKYVPRRTYNTATLKLSFKCKGETVRNHFIITGLGVLAYGTHNFVTSKIIY